MPEESNQGDPTRPTPRNGLAAALIEGDGGRALTFTDAADGSDLEAARKWRGMRIVVESGDVFAEGPGDGQRLPVHGLGAAETDLLLDARTVDVVLVADGDAVGMFRSAGVLPSMPGT